MKVFLSVISRSRPPRRTRLISTAASLLHYSSKFRRRNKRLSLVTFAMDRSFVKGSHTERVCECVVVCLGVCVCECYYV